MDFQRVLFLIETLSGLACFSIAFRNWKPKRMIKLLKKALIWKRKQY